MASESPHEHKEYLDLDEALGGLDLLSLTRSSDPDLEEIPDASPLSELQNRDVFRSIEAEEIPMAGGLSRQGFGFGLDSFDAPSQYHPFNNASVLNPKSSVLNPKMASALIDEQVEPPLAPGGYLEPAYHAMSTNKPVQLFPALLNVLTDCHVDFEEIHEERFKISCVCYRGGARLSLVARLFTVKSGEQYAVEFQRREGSVVHFAQLYRDCRAELAASGMLAKFTQTKTQEHTLAPPPPFVEKDVDTGDAKETMRCLMQMAGSSCNDVRAQALQAIAQLSFLDKDIQTAMIEQGVCETLMHGVGCDYEDVHRCALTAVANLSKEREGVCQIVSADDRVDRLISLANSNTTQVVRETARVLVNLGDTLGTRELTERHPSLRDTIDRLACSRDSVVSHHATLLSTSLSVN